MPLNPLDTIREEAILLNLFDGIKGESRYVDIFKFILENEKKIKRKIYDGTNNREYPISYVKCPISYVKNDKIIIELNNFNNKFKLNKELKFERWLKIELAFICRQCKPSNIFETEDELRTHRKETGHKNIKVSIKTPEEDKQLTIIEDKNNNYIYISQLELIEYSGILAKLNKELKSINLICSVEKRLCSDEKVAMLRFESDIRCNECGKICNTENELKECKEEHLRTRIDIDTARITKQQEEKIQKNRDKDNKEWDRTK